MRCRYQYLSVFAAAAIVISSIAAASNMARADEPLRWKFEVGEKLDYNMVQEMNMSAAGGPVGPMNTTMRQEMDMTWDVQGVDKKTGEAVIKQKFDRVKMKMQTPVGGFEYDSKSEAAPTGLAAMIAPMYKAMTNGEFEITMTARGEVKDVKIPEDVVAALKSSPGAAAMGDIASAEGFKKMISQGALVLPEAAPKKGDTWTTKVEMNNPAAGKQTVETTYRYEGTKDIDGTTYAVIKPQLKMDFEKPAATAGQPAQQLSMKIADQSSDGEVLFNIAKGRLSSTNLQQKVSIDATVNGQSMQQKIDQKIDVKVTPSGEKKADDDAKKTTDEAKKPEASEEKSK
ncbi:MAG TPA: DUF6263 family protein [Lacipirellulaceae bacterium]|jgi:hypothetical protein|nr:DUF6263 family protein [Lacipirellulaceae bacterium]